MRDRIGNGITRREMLAQMAGFAVSLKGASALARSAPLSTRVVKWNDRFELALDVEIAQPGGARSRRPYVAVWMEDKDGAPVRTIALWANTGRGRRWLPELRRWMRASRDGGDLATTASSATRIPGHYSLTWDGRDDAGRPVEQGQYFLCVEAAREHGTYQLIREQYTFGSRAFKAALPGNAEIGGVVVDFREKK
jgi:FAD:protein FMN transferase